MNSSPCVHPPLFLVNMKASPDAVPRSAEFPSAESAMEEMMVVEVDDRGSSVACRVHVSPLRV